MASAGGVLAADDGERENFHRSAQARPPPADTPDPSPAATTSQVTPSIQDFAVSLAAWVPSSLIGAGFLKGAVAVKGGACAITQ